MSRLAAASDTPEVRLKVNSKPDTSNANGHDSKRKFDFFAMARVGYSNEVGHSSGKKR